MIRVLGAGLAVAILAGVGAAVGSGVFGGAGGGWQEVAWPFPQDAWPAGRAFRCQARGCGGEAEVYLRPKLGFCANCAAGVTEDAEVDGVADLDMISADFVPTGAGEQVVIGGLAGHTRAYTLRFADGSRRNGVGFALSRTHRCDLFVAVSQGPAAGTQAARVGLVSLVRSATVAGWISQRLGS